MSKTSGGENMHLWEIHLHYFFLQTNSPFKFRFKKIALEVSVKQIFLQALVEQFHFLKG